jgi:tetratricopeptide (TPR) repeat protein
VTLHPDDKHLTDLRAALEAGDAGQAMASIGAMSEELRDRFDIMGHAADLSGKLGRHEDEIVLLDRLIARDPRIASLHVSRAYALKTLGRSEQAAAAARDALAINSYDAGAWWTLADLKYYRFADDEIATMESALARSPAGMERVQLHFALGRACEQRGGAEEAFTHYSAGNRSIAESLPAGSLSSTVRVDRTIAACTSEFFARRTGFGDPSVAPIFIVGLHRSGSTLIEQILGAHPEIEATSELPVVGQLMRSIALDPSLSGETPLAKLAALDAEQAHSLGADYLRRAAAYRMTEKPRFVDKMPHNWLHIGLICLILPNAVIIDARRHPMAAGVSNFRQLYGRGAEWTYSLPTIGAYYRDYLRLMRHFDRVLPGKVHHIINERLIDDFEPEVRRLLDHAGVAFDPACLDFHRSAGPVRSASAEQVRRPVNRDGVDQWRQFEPWLGPLKDALGPALEDWQE